LSASSGRERSRRWRLSRPSQRATRDHARAQVGRARLAGAVGTYYGEAAGFYEVHVGKVGMVLSVLVEPGSIGLAAPLGGEEEA
jgi:hypothetical protein